MLLIVGTIYDAYSKLNGTDYFGIIILIIIIPFVTLLTLLARTYLKTLNDSKPKQELMDLFFIMQVIGLIH